MKTLVISARDNGTWLAQHLGCTLLNNSAAGDGLVTKVVQLEPEVWNRVIYTDHVDEPIGEAPGRKIYGSSALARKIESDSDYAMTVLSARGLELGSSSEFEGLEVGLLGWWGGTEWEGKRALVIEQTGFMNRDLGLMLNQPQGVTIVPIDSESDLVARTLNKLDSILLNNYRGPVCLRVLVVGKAIYTRYLRLGFEDGWLETTSELQRRDLMDEPLNITDNVAVGILVSVPPYPYATSENNKEYPITVSEGALRHLRLLDVTGCPLECSNTTGRLFYATAWGHKGDSFAREARMRIYRSLRGIEIPSMQYRTDISTVADDCVNQLELLKLI